MVQNQVTLDTLQPLTSVRTVLGETPIYDPCLAAFFWVDIKSQRLYRCAADGSAVQSFTVPVFTSAALLTTKEQCLLLVSQSGLYLFDLASSQCELLLPLELADQGLRPNEAQIDPAGNLWFSTMGVNVESEAGALFKYRIHQAQPQLVMEHITIPNTLVFYADHVYFADTAKGQFYCCKPDGSEIKAFGQPIKGSPDGSCLCEDGLLLNANWALGELQLLDLKQELRCLGSFKVPAQQPSSCALGGTDGQHLLVTSATDGLTELHAADGQIFIANTNLHGQPYNYFAL